MDTLVILTKSLLDNNVNFEVTLRGSETYVRLYDMMTHATIGGASADNVEEALSKAIGSVIGRSSSDQMLSIL